MFWPIDFSASYCSQLMGCYAYPLIVATKIALSPTMLQLRAPPYCFEKRIPSKWYTATDETLSDNVSHLMWPAWVLLLFGTYCILY